MENGKHTVLVVDDESTNRLLMKSVLKKRYNVIAFGSGEECVEYLGKNAVDLIIMDVCMPEMDGYETCKIIKKEIRLRDTPVIFLSAYCALENKLQGYEVGGDDYLTKPYEPEELLIKVKSQIALKESLAESKDMAMMAITNSSELGTVNNFYERSFSCDTIDNLAHQIIGTCHSFGLECSLQIRSLSGCLNVSSTRKQCTALEIDLMAQIRGGERIIHFGRRTAFNFERISLIIENMPRDNESKCG
ncbi:MAG: response regulator, partial [Pseudomonadales bacterium]|nr:response regulator [Pseudomonadales bacterium]